MVWCVISMLAGAALFAAGITFERACGAERGIKMSAPQNDERMDESSLIQWKNLLNYDGNVEEEKYDQ